MIEFILNNDAIETGLPPGTTVLDFVRYHKNLKGTKIGCREGDCGACTILVGELAGENVNYRTMTSCLMPLANAQGKHIVSIEGVNPENGGLTPVQQAVVDESGTQCGFCTVGFVMSLTGFCIDDTVKTCEMALSSIDGNICRCTGYKSIERAAEKVSRQLAEGGKLSTPATVAGGLTRAIDTGNVPEYFAGIPERLKKIPAKGRTSSLRARRSVFVGGGTDLYVQRHDEMTDAPANNLFYDEELRSIRESNGNIEIGASATVTDLLISPMMKDIFPDLYKHLKLVSSTPIRNMATLAGNFVNASPIGDMTVWFLALDAKIIFNNGRQMPLRNFYLDYKRLAKTDNEFIRQIRFPKPGTGFHFNFEKVSKRTYLDIATVNTAMSIQLADSGPPVPAILRLDIPDPKHKIETAHVSVGGVAPIPLYLKETSEFLRGEPVNASTIAQANEIIQAEISPISDVRGTESYKRLLARQLFTAHFYELFGHIAV
ncbi:MAG: FAD binding domain-containing protein [Pyrinomonadaceae bacterium]